MTLKQQLEALREGFAHFQGQATSAAQCSARGELPPEDLGAAQRALQSAFDELIEGAVRASHLPPLENPRSLDELATLIEGVGAADAEAVLDKVLRLRHSVRLDFAPLEGVLAHAAALRGGDSPELSEIAAGTHPLAQLVELVEAEEGADELAAQHLPALQQHFGGALAVAALRGQLILNDELLLTPVPEPLEDSVQNLFTNLSEFAELEAEEPLEPIMAPVELAVEEVEALSLPPMPIEASAPPRSITPPPLATIETPAAGVPAREAVEARIPDLLVEGRLSLAYALTQALEAIEPGRWPRFPSEVLALLTVSPHVSSPRGPLGARVEQGLTRLPVAPGRDIAVDLVLLAACLRPARVGVASAQMILGVLRFAEPTFDALVRGQGVPPEKLQAALRSVARGDGIRMAAGRCLERAVGALARPPAPEPAPEAMLYPHLLAIPDQSFDEDGPTGDPAERLRQLWIQDSVDWPQALRARLDGGDASGAGLLLEWMKATGEAASERSLLEGLITASREGRQAKIRLELEQTRALVAESNLGHQAREKCTAILDQLSERVEESLELLLTETQLRAVRDRVEGSMGGPLPGDSLGHSLLHT